MKVFRCWFDPCNGHEVCCVLVCAIDEKRAIELAKKEISCFPEIANINPQVQEFDTEHEIASIC